MSAKRIMGSAALLALAASLTVSTGTGTATAAASTAPKNFDFNGDGYNDMAVGLPQQAAPAGSANTGMVAVLYGGPNGFTGQKLLRPPTDCSVPTSSGSSSACNSWGEQLAAGDITKDGRTDLVAGSRWYSIVNSWSSAGVAQNRHYFTSSLYNGWENKGLLRVGQFDNQPGADIVKPMRAYYFSGDGMIGWYNGAAEATYQALPPVANPTSASVVASASGDVNGDGKTELVYVNAGDTVDLDVMSPPHTSPLQNVVLASATPSSQSVPQKSSRLEMGDVNGDGNDDVILVTPSLGSLQVWYGSPTGLATTPGFSTNQLTWLNTGSLGSDRGLSVGDVNGDGAADIAIGVADATVSGKAGAGMVAVIPGSANGPVLTGTQYITQDSLGSTPAPTPPLVDPVGEQSKAGDGFGYNVSIIDVTGDGKGEVIVGTPGKNGNVGMLAVLRGSATGVSATNAQVVHPGGVGITSATRFGVFLLR
ncbi:FG-GAP-like repeat-containing protein [Streptosporangium sp. NPDC001681]|uniref:FG-GAP-like repeat-containing protein n=1 Tax=Streptosporangium sp. NPDC001681 TaxID=3154395 RepID=UPI003326A7A6